MAIVSPALDPSQPTGLFLNGRFQDRGRQLTVRSPFTGEPIATVARAGDEDVGEAVALARAHMPDPPPAHERAAVLERAARRVSERAEAFARTICLEAGKPIRQARVEVQRCVDTLTFSAAEARTTGGDIVPMDASAAGEGHLGLVLRRPAGVVGAIAPFNFPLNLVAHKVAPAIAAGCPVVLKPASATPLSALMLAQALSDAGLHDGMLGVVIGGGAEVGNSIVDHPGVPLISFTGSPQVGWDIRARVPRKEVALELGNATPVIVADDADLDAAAAKIAASGYTHAGQSCISVQRVYAHESVADAFTVRLVDHVGELVTGDPMDERTDVGPVIDDDSRQRIVEWVDEARRGGARVACGGTVSDGLIAPTVLEDIAPDMRVTCQELFGPVVGVARFSRVDEAIADRALQWARHLDFGGVTINETPTFRADQQPYGGVKDSGNTREGPRYALQTMTDPRLIVIGLPREH
jgi:acyl-CoA reductase-like NAD-dependent aldehyde dehydrogenase